MITYGDFIKFVFFTIVKLLNRNFTHVVASVINGISTTVVYSAYLIESHRNILLQKLIFAVHLISSVKFIVV